IDSCGRYCRNGELLPFLPPRSARREEARLGRSPDADGKTRPMTKSGFFLLAATMLVAAAPLQAASEPAKRDLSGTVPVELTQAQRADYAAIFAALRASDWIGASTRLALVGEGPLTAFATAELYLAKNSPKVELEPLM